jgi:hypothetical protein
MKYALIIGNNKYDDQKLAQLKTPAADSQALAKILDDKTIGSFDEVTPLINQTETRVRRAISTFLTNRKYALFSLSLKEKRGNTFDILCYLVISSSKV